MRRIAMFRSLGVRNYRIYALGQLVSNPGTWMQRIAQDWLVLQLSGGSGNDTITGGAGNDFLGGGFGDDTINANDGFADRVNCGDGTDTANIDNFDVLVSDDCETVNTTQFATLASEDKPPTVAWTAPASAATTRSPAFAAASYAPPYGQAPPSTSSLGRPASPRSAAWARTPDAKCWSVTTSRG